MRIGAAQRELARNKGERFLAPSYACVTRTGWIRRFRDTVLPKGARFWYKGDDELWWLGNLGATPRGRKRAVPGVKKSLIAVQTNQDDPTCIVGSRAAARESRKCLGKTGHPARHRCARDTPTTTSMIFCSVYYTGVTSLCDELPR